MIQVKKWNNGYTMVYDFLLRCTFKEKVNEKYFKFPVTRIGVMLVLSQLIRRSNVVNSDSFEITTTFLSTCTGLSSATVKRYLQTLRDLKIISWDKRKDRKARSITINYGILDRMYDKYQLENASYDEGIKTESEPTVESMSAEPESTDDTTTKIVQIMMKHNSTMDIMFMDEIQAACGYDEKLRRECTRKAKEIIKKGNYIK